MEQEKTSEEVILELQDKIKNLTKENNKLKIDFNTIDIAKSMIEGELELLKLNNEKISSENSKIKEKVLDNTSVKEEEVVEVKEKSYEDFFIK